MIFLTIRSEPPPRTVPFCTYDSTVVLMIGSLNPVHVVAQDFQLLSPREQMNVISHQTVMLDFKRLLFKITFKNLQKFFEVLFVVKKPGFIIPPHNDMIKPNT